MRSVVTGGAGFIGSHLVDRLVGLGDTVTVVDDLSTGRRERVPDGVALHELDVADANALTQLAREHGPFDRWFHLAAQADVRVSVRDPLEDARVNVLGTIAVLEAARLDTAPVVFSSTGGAIYGDAPLPTPETADEAPESPYGAAKLAAEKYIEMHARLYGLRHAIVRYANVYGPRQDPHGEAGVVAIFGGRIIDGQPATIFGDGSQTRDYVYVGDVVEATVRAAEVGTGTATGLPPVHADGAMRLPGSGTTRQAVPVYNIGTGIETSVNELWDAMCEAAGTQLPASYADPRPGELARSALDASRAREELGARLDTPLVEGLQRTLESLRLQRA